MGESPTDPLEELARDLRQSVGGELRAESEITEQETHIGRLRRRGLADVVTEAMHRGDLVSVITGARTITGSPVFTGSDYLVCVTSTEIVDAPFDRTLIRIERRPHGGHSTTGGAKTFKARLAELEHTGEIVTLVVADTQMELQGRIAVAASDHCVFEEVDGSNTYVPIGQICLIIRPRSDTDRSDA